MPIVLSGLPGVGKTTIARELARVLPAVHVRVDSKQGLRQAGLASNARAALSRMRSRQMLCASDTPWSPTV